MSTRRTEQVQFPLPVVALGVVLLIAAGMIYLLQARVNGGAPSIAVDKQTIDYGDVKLNTDLSFEIKVTNRGTGVLRFKEKPYIEVLEGC